MSILEGIGQALGITPKKTETTKTAEATSTEELVAQAKLEAPAPVLAKEPDAETQTKAAAGQAQVQAAPQQSEALKKLEEKVLKELVKDLKRNSADAEIKYTLTQLLTDDKAQKEIANRLKDHTSIKDPAKKELSQRISFVKDLINKVAKASKDYAGENIEAAKEAIGLFGGILGANAKEGTDDAKVLSEMKPAIARELAGMVSGHHYWGVDAKNRDALEETLVPLALKTLLDNFKAAALPITVAISGRHDGFLGRGFGHGIVEKEEANKLVALALTSSPETASLIISSLTKSFTEGSNHFMSSSSTVGESKDLNTLKKMLNEANAKLPEAQQNLVKVIITKIDDRLAEIGK